MTGQDISKMIQFFFRLVETDFCSTFTAENRPKDFLAALLRWVLVFGFESFVSLLLRRFLRVGHRDRRQTILVDGTVEDEHRSILILVRFVSKTEEWIDRRRREESTLTVGNHD